VLPAGRVAVRQGVDREVRSPGRLPAVPEWDADRGTATFSRSSTARSTLAWSWKRAGDTAHRRGPRHPAATRVCATCPAEVGHSSPAPRRTAGSQIGGPSSFERVAHRDRESGVLLSNESLSNGCSRTTTSLSSAVVRCPRLSSTLLREARVHQGDSAEPPTNPIRHFRSTGGA
jgi:hypothetical protein